MLNIGPIELSNQKVMLAHGYQSVSGQVAGPVLNGAIKTTEIVDPQFSYMATLCQSSTELQRKLQVSVGLTGQAYNVKANAQGSYSSETDEQAQSHYYCIELSCLERYAMLDETAGGQVIEPVKTGPGADIEGFYKMFGDRYINRVDYGKKLVAVIEIKKKHMSKTTEWMTKVDVNVPIYQNATVGGNINLSALLGAISDDQESEIRIYAIGDNSADLQMKTVKGIQDLRSTLESFVAKNSGAAAPAKPSTPPATEATPPKAENGPLVQQNHRLSSLNLPLLLALGMQLEPLLLRMPQNPLRTANLRMRPLNQRTRKPSFLLQRAPIQSC